METEVWEFRKLENLGWETGERIVLRGGGNPLAMGGL
jgi:hypothetical protein